MAAHGATTGSASSDGQRLVFADFAVDLRRGCLMRHGELIALRPKPYAMLLYLLEHAGRLVTREELQDAVWPGVVVTDDSIAQCLIELRRALGDHERSLIRTVPRRGLILEAAVRFEGAATPGARLVAVRNGLPLWVAVAAILVLAVWWARDRHFARIPAATPATASIAVMRFTDLSPAGDNAWLADGLGEELMHRLSQSPALRVIARTTSFAIEGQPISAIAAQLGVTHVLEGSVRTQGDTVRVTTQLIDAATSRHLWSKTYDGNVVDILALQEEIARSVADSLEAGLAGAQDDPETDPRAYALFLEGNHYYRRGAEGDMAKARERYEQAVEISPGFARAWADLARVAAAQISQLSSGQDQDMDREALQEMLRRAVEQALRFGPNLPEAHIRAAQYYFEIGDNARSLEHAETARSLDPGHWLVRMLVATQLRLGGRLEESIPLVRLEIQRDPLHPALRVNLVHFLIWARRFEEAQAELDEALELFPSPSDRSPELNEAIPLLQILLGDYAAAVNSIDALPESVGRTQLRAINMHGRGLPAESDAELANLVSDARIAWDAHRIAEVHAFRGEGEFAMRWLNGIDWRPACRDLRLAQFVYYSPFLTRLEGTPAWDEYRANRLQYMRECSLGLEVDPARSFAAE